MTRLRNYILRRMTRRADKKLRRMASHVYDNLRRLGAIDPGRMRKLKASLQYWDAVRGGWTQDLPPRRKAKTETDNPAFTGPGDGPIAIRDKREANEAATPADIVDAQEALRAHRERTGEAAHHEFCTPCRMRYSCDHIDTPNMTCTAGGRNG